jgi:multimeric flavodoxin WrbA
MEPPVKTQHSPHIFGLGEGMPTYDDLTALYVNCTLKRSPEQSHTQGLMDASIELMERQGARVDTLRLVDYGVADGVYPDMREHGWTEDAWPDVIWPKVRDADILVVGSPLWLGEPSSISRRFVERLYAMSDQTNEKGQYVFYGKVAGTITTGNEDGVKSSGKQLLYAFQHLGFTIPPAAETGWIGPIGPGPSYLDDDSGGPESEYTRKTMTFATWNLLHVARLLTDAGGIPAVGNVPGAWQSSKGDPNPEYR